MSLHINTARPKVRLSMTVLVLRSPLPQGVPIHTQNLGSMVPYTLTIIKNIHGRYEIKCDEWVLDEFNTFLDARMQFTKAMKNAMMGHYSTIQALSNSPLSDADDAFPFDDIFPIMRSEFYREDRSSMDEEDDLRVHIGNFEEDADDHFL